ncbi:hypothetical protein [Erythrobacter sp.]|jgi:hypothetical protein|uniref:hypothetical protein n=1 Tax=Erythrobacter sp. TaxID=1042 RepID=UPI002E9E7256|nr:hypothetical protein [Erythrobacter sp.]
MYRCVQAFLTSLIVLALGACADDSVAPGDGDNDPLSQDPILARALFDPLMTDPDLATRNEANAAITWRDAHPLPPMIHHEDAAARASEAAQIELLRAGPIPALPGALSGAGSALGELTSAAQMLGAVGASSDCAAQVTGELGWAARMPDVAAIMPHGMIHQAAGAEEGDCAVHIARYQTPVDALEALEYHLAVAIRAGFTIERYNAPELQFHGRGKREHIAVHAREGPGGLAEIDIIYWRG